MNSNIYYYQLQQWMCHIFSSKKTPKWKEINVIKRKYV